MTTRVTFILVGMVLLLTTSPSISLARGVAAVGPRVGHCGFVKTATRLRDEAKGKKLAVSLPFGAAVKIIAVKGAWLRVGQVNAKQGCFGKQSVAPAGWLKRGRLAPVYLLASQRRSTPVQLGRGRPLFRFDRQQMVLKAFGKTSPTLDDEGGQGFRVWTTGQRRYPFAFHTMAWDMGPGSLTLFGRKGMLSLTSPGTRFTVEAVGGAFHMRTDHLCLQLALGLQLAQMIKRKGWPRRFEVQQVALRGAKQGAVLQLDLHPAKIAPQQLPVVGVSLSARDARRPNKAVQVPRGTYFRPRALILETRDGETRPALEVELLPGKRRVLMGQPQVVKTTLLVHCAG
jgi:hypothetical protein